MFVRRHLRCWSSFARLRNNVSVVPPSTLLRVVLFRTGLRPLARLRLAAQNLRSSDSARYIVYGRSRPVLVPRTGRSLPQYKQAFGLPITLSKAQCNRPCRVSSTFAAQMYWKRAPKKGLAQSRLRRRPSAWAKRNVGRIGVLGENSANSANWGRFVGGSPF